MATYVETFPTPGPLDVGQDQPWSSGGWEVYGTPLVASPSGAGRGVNTYIRMDSDLDGADHALDVTVSDLGSHSTNRVGALVRVGMDNTSYAVILGGTGVMTIELMSAGSSTSTLATAPGTVSITTPGVLRAEVEGSAIRGYWNDSLILSTTDSTLTTATRTGLWAYERSESVYVTTSGVVAADLDAAPAPAEGAISGGVAWSGSATGYRDPVGTISGGVAWSGTVTGDAPTVAANEGSISGSVSWAGTATGECSPVGSITGGVAWSGTLVGKRVAIGGASGQIVWDGFGVGKREPVGTASGTVDWTGTVTGSAPDVGSSIGTIAGTVAWAGTLVGTRHPKAIAAGAVQWAGTATGHREPKGTIAGTVGWTGTAVGQSPAPGVKAGTILGGVGWTGTAAGRRDPVGSIGGTVAWAGTLDGHTVRSGTVSGAVGWTGSIVGRGSGFRDITIALGLPRLARTLTTAGLTPARILTLSGPRRTRP